MEKVRYALIGFGGIAENRIAKEGFARDAARFPNSPDIYELVGAFDLNTARRPAVEALGLRWYDSLQSLLGDASIDAVFIATNNLTHAQMATAALDADKHVIVEKPLAARPEDVVSMMKLARSKGRSLSVDHMMIYNKLNIKAKELIASGKLGRVNDSCFHMEFSYGSTPEEAATWRCCNVSELGGPIGDVASHCFYMAEFLFEDVITAVAASYLPKTLDIAVEDGAYIKFKMQKGQIGSVKVAFSEQRGGLGGTLSNLGFEVYGTEAALRSFGTLFQLSGYPDEPIPIRLELDAFSVQENITLAGAPTPNIYQGVIRHHAESILKNEPIQPEDGLRNVRLCFAAHQSAQSGGGWVAVE